MLYWKLILLAGYERAYAKLNLNPAAAGST